MRVWHTNSSRALTCLRRSSLFVSPLSREPFHPLRQLHVWSRDQQHSHRRYDIPQALEPPSHNAEAWVTLLESALPLHLRRGETLQSAAVLGAEDIAKILLAAQYPKDPDVKGIDVLHHLGFAAGRWHAVVWLVKILAEHFPIRHGRRSPLTTLVEQRPKFQNLHQLTETAIILSKAEPSPQSILTPSLHDLTDGSAQNTTIEERLQHDALGQVWRTIGLMTQTCAGGEIKPEVLEIIAFLHHKEIMPQSIYHYSPNVDEHAIQTPPLLSLLSSRILTSLSDAAWRAHEKLVVEEAKAKGGEYAALRPEVPGSVYRVHVSGLRPELWMELILWSCLRGGWIMQGSEILQSLSADPAWKPISWQDHARQISRQDNSDNADWDTWDYRFKTRAPDTMDADPRAAEFKIDRTVSSEVVSAYADALVTSVSLGVGQRGISMSDIVARLRDFQQFLRRSRLGLSTGTWDSLIVRLIDHDQTAAERHSQLTQDLISLSPDIRERLRFSARGHTLPDYVSDGNSAMQGLLHRSLNGQIQSGYLESALSVLWSLLDRADVDKFTSIISFFRHPHESVLGLAEDKQMFTGNFSGIEYPAFDAQIPLEMLGSLMHLAMVHGAYDVVDWMIRSDDIDGPIVSPQIYTHRHIQPALMRYAAETDDQALFAVFAEEASSRASLIGILDTQISGLRWQAVDRLMKHLRENESVSWSPQNLALLTRAMLLLDREARAGAASASKNFREAQSLFDSMVTLQYESPGRTSKTRFEKIQSLVSVLSTVDARWQTFCERYMQDWTHYNFSMTSDAFNFIIEGVADSYGSSSARRVLGIFWPHAARDASDNASAFGPRQIARMRKYRPGILMTLKRQRISILKRSESEQLSIYGAVVPNTRTILIILDKALQELQRFPSNTMSPAHSLIDDERAGQSSESDTPEQFRDDSTPADMVRWAIYRLLELPELDSNLLKKLDAVLELHEMHELRAKLPKLLDEAGVRSGTPMDE